MLIRFSASNFRSIFKAQELSLVATPLKDSEANLLPCAAVPGGHTLSSAIVYGANASGKSNLIRALDFMRDAVLTSHPLGQPESEIAIRPFALDESAKTLPSTFDLDFIVDGIRYNYGFSLTRKEFTSEWLYTFPSNRRQMLFERRTSREISFGRHLKGRNRVIADLMRPNSLFMSAAVQNDHTDLTKIAEIFTQMILSDMVSVGRGAVQSRVNTEGFDPRTINFLQAIGTGITGFRQKDVERTPKSEEFEKNIKDFITKVTSPDAANSLDYSVLMRRVELSHKTAKGQEVFFDVNDESAGTRRLMVMMNLVFKALDSGAIIIIDELDASLHTQACEAIVALFAHKTTNLKKAQLIATTHDTNLMRSSLLRRDQLWFTEKDDEGATHLFPLSDIKTRHGDNIEKGYLQGRFGAIPFSGSVDRILASI